MINFILNLFANTEAMKKLQADAIQKGVYRGTEEERARQNEAQKRSRIIQAESFLDAPIITLSNEWNNR